MGVGRQRQAPAALLPGKTQYPLYRRLGGLEPVWVGAENVASTGIRSPDRPAWRGVEIGSRLNADSKLCQLRQLTRYFVGNSVF